MNKEDLKNYKMKNEKKKINILNIENEIKNIIIDNNKYDIKELNYDLEKYLKDKEKIKIMKEYFKNYDFYISKNIYILKNEKEIIIIRNSKEREFFFNSHIKFYLENKKENELIYDFEKRLNEILIYKNYIIFDYIKFDFEIIK